VTAADVQRVARRYLDPARFSVVVTGKATAQGTSATGPVDSGESDEEAP
jgi:predicted Zn-dependent peptidase